MYSLRFFSRFGRFHEDFTLKEGTVFLTFSRNRPENHSQNLGKALGEGLGLLKTGSLSLSLSLSPLFPFHLSIPFTSLYLSLPLYISPSNFLSLSLLSIILFGISNRRFRPCLKTILYFFWFVISYIFKSKMFKPRVFRTGIFGTQ